MQSITEYKAKREAGLPGAATTFGDDWRHRRCGAVREAVLQSAARGARSAGANDHGPAVDGRGCAGVRSCGGRHVAVAADAEVAALVRVQTDLGGKG